ncbi:MAG: CoA pyrophosphatase, partial [Acidobacteria bacterium]|nr:CoA pyrophosphatase [Acidobacteriota bacterium]
MPYTLLDLDGLRRRLAHFDSRRLEGDRRAAVAVIFRPGAEGAEVLLIHRAEHPRDPWSGHVAFPGGRMDPEDESALAAAVRETVEEIGLDLSTEAVHLGRFSDLQAVAKGRRLGLVIEPFAFELAGSETLVINHEVQEAFWLPLSFLTDWSHRSSLEYTIDRG